MYTWRKRGDGSIELREGAKLDGIFANESAALTRRAGGLSWSPMTCGRKMQTPRVSC